MLEIIVSIAVILVVAFVFILDGDVSKIPFLNKNNSNKKQKDDKFVYKYKNTKKMKPTQDRLPFKSIKSYGSILDKALILRRDDETYVGVIEIYGANYNLLSIKEKLQLEEYFQTVLNGIEYPIQIFIQSRKMDIDNYNRIYEERIEELRDLQKKEINKFNFLKEQGALQEELRDIESNIRRIGNQIEYGIKVIEFINNIAYNSEIVDKKYYIAVRYTYDKGLFSQGQTEDEKFVTALNTISNRLDSIFSGLSKSPAIGGKVLNGTELAELIYTSFNKHDSSNYKILNAIRSGFSNFVVTSRPVEHKILEYEENKLEELAKEVAS